MANSYLFKFGKTDGTATITVTVDSVVIATVANGDRGLVSIEQGKTVTIDVALNPGFVSFTTQSARITGGPFTSSPFNFTMPESDASMSFIISGENIPVDGYQLKYFWDWKSQGDDRSLEIYEDDFAGYPDSREIQRFILTAGERESDLIDTFLRQSCTFDIIASGDDFAEFLTGDNRKFQVKYYHGTDLKFTGYVLTDRIQAPEGGDLFVQTFQATDGIRSFDSKVFIPQVKSSAPNSTGFIMGGLNQTFVEARDVNISCEIYEDAMDNTECLFNQFFPPFASFYTDGEIAKFTDGVRIQNENLTISETLQRLLRPFFCRVFLQDNEWWIIRVSDMNKSSLEFFSFLADGTEVTGFDLTINNQAFDCNNPKFGNAIKTSDLIYNQFTTILKLGVLDNSARGGIYETRFVLDDFFVYSTSSIYVGLYRLRVWNYENVIPFNPAVPVFSGTTAKLAYVSGNDGEYAEIITTTATSGLSDTNISFIELNASQSGQSIGIVQETANSISVGIQWQLVRVSDTSTPVNPGSNNQFGIMVRVGNNWLSYDSGTKTFSWALTENIMLWTAPSGGDWNTLLMSKIPVPATDNLIVRIYQTICTGGTINKFKLRIRNFRIDIEQTEGLANASIEARGVVDGNGFDRVFPDYVTHIGDAVTANSQSAIIYNGQVSESWTDQDVTSLPLLQNQTQVLANMKGRRNLRINGKLYSNELPDLRKAVQYNSKNFVINYFSHDSGRGETEISMIEIQP